MRGIGVFAALTVASAFAVSSAEAKVYFVDETVGLGTVVGTITTDGTIGNLTSSDFTAWDLHLNGVGASTEITSSDANKSVWGNTSGDVTANSSHVYFNFDGANGGYLVFQDGQSSGAQYWCLNAGGGACLKSESDVPQYYSDSSAQIISRIGNQIVATAAPEPSTWAMMLFGFAGLGFAGYRQTRSRSVVAAA